MQNLSYLEDLTEKLLVESGLFSAPVDLEALVAALGIKKDEQDLEIGISGMAVVHGNLKIISVDKKQHDHRKRFTIGHELGHIFLDSSSPLNIDHNVYYRNGISDRKELRANYFSASLLMPRKLIQKYLDKNNPNLALGDDEIAQIASDFRVSTQAMCIRLSTLGYV